MQNVNKIKFYTDYNNSVRAIVVYNDGIIKDMNKKNAVIVATEIAKEKGFKSFDELKANSVLEFISYEESKSILDNYRKVKVQTQKVIKEEQENGHSNKISSAFKWTRRITFFIALGLLFNTKPDCKFHLKNVDEIIIDLIDMIPTSLDDEDEETDITKEVTIEDVVDLISGSNINAVKRDYFQKMWAYLRHYNVEIADSYKTKTKKLAHEFDEVEAQYLMYNNLEPTIYACIFKKGDITGDMLKQNYQKAIKEDISFHMVQNDTLGIQSIINKDETQEYYMNYELMLINFNRESNNKIKVNQANNFFKKVRSDFNHKEKITLPMLTVEPIIKAMQKLCNEHPQIHSLSNKELKYINKLFENKINEIATNYDRYILFDSSKNSEISRSLFEETVISYLQNNNSYMISEEERNIKEGKLYKTNYRWQYKEKKKIKAKQKN